MANRHIETVPISDGVVDGIRQNFSLRELAKKIDIGDRTLRYWLERKEMPTYLWHKIFPIVKDYVPCKTLWMRIGVTVPLSESELYYFMKVSEQSHVEIYPHHESGFENVDISECVANELLKRGAVDGDSYIPACCLEEHKDWYYEEQNKKGEK